MFSRAAKRKNGTSLSSFYHIRCSFINILAQSDDFIVVDKPFGMFSQGGTNVNSKSNLIDTVAELCPTNQVYSVHRLDRDTSGVMIFAKSKAMAQHLSHQFASGQVKKVYHAVTLGIPPSEDGVIDEPLAEVKHGSMIRVCVDRTNGKPAKTHFTVKQANYAVNLALIELRPSTGHKHQLRVHCLFMNCPILGDVKYGGLVFNNKNQRKFLQESGIFTDNNRSRLMLHASELRFVDMKGEECAIKADPPWEFKRLIS